MEQLLNEVVQYAAQWVGLHGYWHKQESVITVEMVRGPGRDKPLVAIRQLFCTVARTMRMHSLSEIGRALGRDHSTVVHSVRTGYDRLRYDAYYKSMHEYVMPRVNSDLLHAELCAQPQQVYIVYLGSQAVGMKTADAYYSLMPAQISHAERMLLSEQLPLNN
jgi:hypothetical protein